MADVDLGSTIFSYVFGESRLGGDAAIVSMRRLRPEEYGLPADPLLPLARLRRVVLHEVGHLAGLLHCREPDCVMRFSGVAEEVDLLDDGFCAVCGETFLDHLRAGGAASSPPPIDSGDGR
ncbi:MAG: archaemetzincin [Candidatus Eisenbacteria bacterium]